MNADEVGAMIGERGQRPGNDRPGGAIRATTICVHLRSSAVECFNFLGTQKPGKSQMNKRMGLESKIQNDASDLKTWPGEVNQQAQSQTSSLEVIHTLGPMRVVQLLYSLKLHEHLAFDQQVSDIFPNDDAIIPDRNSVLCGYRNTSLTKFMRQCVFVNLLGKSTSKCVGNC